MGRSSRASVLSYGSTSVVAGNPHARRRRSGALRVVLALCLAVAVSLVGAASSAAQAPAAPKVLLYHGGTSNGSVTAGVDAIEQLGADNDFTVDATAAATAFTEANLAGYRAVVVLHSSGDVLNAAQRAALQAYVQGGGGFVGIGEAANLQPGDTFFSGLIGARPAASSSTATVEEVVEAGDRVHPATRELPLEWTRSDVWYQWQQNPTGQVHTVARVRTGSSTDDGQRGGSTTRPISWCRDFQGGRSFYTGMGRTAASYGQENLQDHLLGAIQWAAGLVRGGCKATIAANYESVRLTSGDNGLANAGEAHGVSVASNGWAITIGRASCATNAERGARVGQATLPRILDFANPNVGVGCAPIHVWDPEEYDGTVNSGNTRAGTLTVYGDRGGGSEINGKIETGGLGIAASPDFAQTGHVYILYFPSFNPSNPVHPGLEDGAQRRITKMAKGRISRFTIDLDTKELDLDSEVKIFEYDSQIYSCCHRGGGMGFDSDGNLYVTTGDSNSSGSTGGYSGNFQPNRCPTGDPTVASNAHCGSNGVSYNDARRTAGSTNDYNGKMLRINPIEGLADGAAVPVGVGRTYQLPTAASPNGPNLFDGTEGGGNRTRPEIYAMGLRNPSRLAIDPLTDKPYSAWVGPDAGSPSVTQGPSTYEVASQIPRAQNMGWPYCMGNQQAYRDRVANGSLRTTNGNGFVNGGPAGSPTPGWYDCDNLVNDSTNNTGLQVLPHATGTGRDAGTAAPANLWYSRGNPGGDGCPDFPRPNGADTAPNYGATNTQLCPWFGGGGNTVMSGPVYRYAEGAEAEDGRWPEYWDGRWFVHDFSSGNSRSFGYLFDEAAAAAGGQPSYVDKMSLYMNWAGGAYMDSKYGPDGALYLQTYNGNYFEAGQADGLHRIAYTGGPDTPGPDPQWTNEGGGEIAFSIGRSGGVSYEWDFGDGTAVSNGTAPSHTYAQQGAYDVTLTVTYADDEEVTETIAVNASSDTAAAVTTATLAPAQPGAGGTYGDDVTVTLSAADGGTGALGVEYIEHRVNTDGQTGEWQRADNGGTAGPFTTTLTVEDEGDHVVQFRSRDRAGNVEAIRSVAFEIAFPDAPSGGSCLPQSDEFGGGALDDKWDVLRQAGGGPQVANGNLTLPFLPGDFIANDQLASNTLLQDTPNGPWTATVKVDASTVNDSGEQAGLVVWKSEQPNSFTKIVAIRAGSGTNQFEHIVTRDGSVNPPIAQSITQAPGGQFPEDLLLRARYDGTAVIAEFSGDDGASWTRIGQQGHQGQFEGPLRVGLVAFRGSQGGGDAGFEWFRLLNGADADAPVACGGGCSPQSDQFEGGAVDGKWELANPSADVGARPSVEGGHLNLPLVPGDLYGDNGSAQMLLQQAPQGSWVATAKIAHANVNANGEAAGLALVNRTSPNHFLKTAIQYKSDTNPDQAGDQNGKWAERVLTADGSAVILPPATVPWPNSGALSLSGEYVWVRFVHDAEAGTITTWTSTNGTTFTSFGAPISVEQYLGEPGGLRIGLFGKHDGSGDDEVQVDAFNVVAGTADAQTSGDDCGGQAAGDTTAPRTTHTLDPAEPDGDGGWYTSPVEVTLAATDNDGGSGVETTEFRLAGQAQWTAYANPLSFTEDGEYELEYRSTDADGNTEAVRRVSFRVDAADPTTTARLNGAAPAARYSGPVEVDLDAEDGDGSGVRRTEVRVDGGEWQPYAEEEVILNSAADLEAWEQAGPGGLNWNTAEGGFARTFGGLGMPWYPKEYGDFSLKMQWRDSTPGAQGNGGIFARFPHPEQTVQRPAAERYPCQVGSATSSPAWVAIFCGHEIQINDAQTSEPQKTGSIYNFEPLNLAQARVQPKGTWVDYELRVVGQTYTIIRNGEVLQTWENAPDQQSSRGGDPSTSARQFARGYIGLQNHGSVDVMDYRNIRIQSLDEGARQGPFTVQGDGEHTVEFRSTDNAGNLEAAKQVTFTIGDAVDATPPRTSHALDPAQPGAGGRYDGPVRVTLSAADPAEGGPPAETHDVVASSAIWTPSQVTARVGDTVRWTFPVTAGPPHDVWVIAPGQPADADGTKLGGPVDAGGPPVSYQVPQAGTWTFVCKIHSFRQNGRWVGMVGTIDAAAAEGGTPGSGVGFTEYRVDTGDALGVWQRANNAGAANPFETSFTVSGAGSHRVQYRSTDAAGNAEEIKSVDFSIGGGAENRPPTVTASANVASGTAPLAVQFSAAGSDPDGGPLEYAWDFGDGGRATGASAAHTYAQPGDYTATVTITDVGGLRTTASVRISVTLRNPNPPGNPPGGDGDGDGPGRTGRNEFTVPRLERMSLDKFARHGLNVHVVAQGAMRGSVRLRIDKRTARRLRIGRTLDTANVRITRAQNKRVKLLTSRKVARKLRRYEGSVTLTVKVRMKAGANPARTVIRRVMLRG